MLVYITYPLLVFYFSSNPYLKTSFRFLVRYCFLGLLFRVGSVNGIVLSQMSSLVSLLSVVPLFLFGLYVFLQISINWDLHILQLILSTFFPFYHFCFDPYILTIRWSFGDKVRNAKLFLSGFELASYVRCGLIKSILIQMFLPINISTGVRFFDCMRCWSIRGEKING